MIPLSITMPPSPAGGPLPLLTPRPCNYYGLASRSSSPECAQFVKSTSYSIPPRPESLSLQLAVMLSRKSLDTLLFPIVQVFRRKSLRAELALIYCFCTPRNPYRSHYSALGLSNCANSHNIPLSCRPSVLPSQFPIPPPYSFSSLCDHVSHI